MFDAETEQLDTIPVWVLLPRLPLEFWNPACHSDIGNELGTFIEVDLSFQQTNIKKVARILVSLNIRTSLPEAFNLYGKTRKKDSCWTMKGFHFDATNVMKQDIW